jgi:hypothetical protein
MVPPYDMRNQDLNSMKEDANVDLELSISSFGLEHSLKTERYRPVLDSC